MGVWARRFRFVEFAFSEKRALLLPLWVLASALHADAVSSRTAKQLWATATKRKVGGFHAEDGPEHWGDVLPAAILCDPQFDYLRTPRDPFLRKDYSAMITDPFFDDDWLRGLDELFKIKS